MLESRLYVSSPWLIPFPLNVQSYNARLESIIPDILDGTQKLRVSLFVYLFPDSESDLVPDYFSSRHLGQRSLLYMINFRLCSVVSALTTLVSVVTLLTLTHAPDSTLTCAGMAWSSCAYVYLFLRGIRTKYVCSAVAGAIFALRLDCYDDFDEVDNCRSNTILNGWSLAEVEKQYVHTFNFQFFTQWGFLLSPMSGQLFFSFYLPLLRPLFCSSVDSFWLSPVSSMLMSLVRTLKSCSQVPTPTLMCCLATPWPLSGKAEILFRRYFASNIPWLPCLILPYAALGQHTSL